MTTSEHTSGYKDDDLVYVDPDTKSVVGIVEFDANGTPKKLERPSDPKEGDRPGRTREKRYYPWGTYRSLKKVYQLEGKQKRAEGGATLDSVLPKALEQAFWND